MFFCEGRKPENPEKTHVRLHTGPIPTSGVTLEFRERFRQIIILVTKMCFATKPENRTNNGHLQLQVEHHANIKHHDYDLSRCLNKIWIKMSARLFQTVWLRVFSMSEYTAPILKVQAIISQSDPEISSCGKQARVKTQTHPSPS